MSDLLDDDDVSTFAQPTELPFAPVTQAHIMNCSYHSWHPKYKTLTPKSRLIPLTKPFLDYLRADGIILPDDDDDNTAQPVEWDSDSGVFSSTDNVEARNNESDDEQQQDITAGWSALHAQIKSTIAELGGAVLPKLNWSAPKDATWMNANTMECRTPNDIYLLLKSSDFITHDLEHAFDDTISTPACNIPQSEMPYHLVLRKAFQMNPSVEFRCFVRGRKLLCICQRDLNYYDFLAPMEGKLRSLIKEFFELRLRDTFEDESFVFDCYVPNSRDKVWLVDVNPWAPRTDPLLFSWREVLGMAEPPEEDERGEGEGKGTEGFVRLSLNSSAAGQGADSRTDDLENVNENENDDEGEDDSDTDADETLWLPELRLVKQSDPEAYSFSTPQYSAHKLPRDVVDASQSGEGLREFAKDWQSMLEKKRWQQDQEDGESSSGEE